MRRTFTNKSRVLFLANFTELINNAWLNLPVTVIISACEINVWRLKPRSNECGLASGSESQSLECDVTSSSPRGRVHTHTHINRLTDTKHDSSDRFNLSDVVLGTWPCRCAKGCLVWLILLSYPLTPGVEEKPGKALRLPALWFFLVERSRTPSEGKHRQGERLRFKVPPSV